MTFLSKLISKLNFSQPTSSVEPEKKQNYFRVKYCVRRVFQAIFGECGRKMASFLYKSNRNRSAVSLCLVFCLVAVEAIKFTPNATGTARNKVKKRQGKKHLVIIHLEK